MRKALWTLAVLTGICSWGARAQVYIPATPPPKTAPQTDVISRGRSLATAFYAVQVTPLWTAFTPEMQAAWGSLEQFTAYRQAGLAEYGEETTVLDESVVERDGLEVYVRTAVFAKHPQEVWSVLVGFDAQGRVAFFNIVQQDSAPTVPQQG